MDGFEIKFANGQLAIYFGGGNYLTKGDDDNFLVKGNLFIEEIRHLQCARDWAKCWGLQR